MKQEIKLEVIGDKVKVFSPYNEKFVAKARNLRGTWKDSAWWFDDSLLDYVREVMMDCFGTTGEIPYETCTLIVRDFSKDSLDAIRLFGRTIVMKPYSRDGYAKLGDDIVLLEGNASCGGSHKYPKAYISNATFEMQNFPIPSLELPDVKAAIEAGWCEVKMSKKKRPTEEISAEIEALKVRIKELENELVL